MSTQATLSARKRDGTGKGVARKLRAAGEVPAVLYGKGEEPLALALNAHQAEKLFSSVSVENTVIDLSVDGGGAIQTLVREIQAHPYRHQLLHVDFLRLTRGVAVELEIPVHLVGTPEGVRTDGGLLEHVLHAIRIRCIPSAIPEAAELDVSGLGIGDGLHVSDVKLPEGVEILNDPEVLVCAVQAPRVTDEETPDAPAAGEAGEAAEA